MKRVLFDNIELQDSKAGHLGLGREDVKMAHTLSYSDYSYSSHDESQTEGECDTLQWRQRQGELLQQFISPNLP